jgi:hypothetical protein
MTFGSPSFQPLVLRTFMWVLHAGASGPEANRWFASLSHEMGEGSYGSAEFGSADESTHTKVG